MASLLNAPATLLMRRRGAEAALPLAEALGLSTAEINNTHNMSHANKAVAADYVFVYFSAHWCPPCRQFTPVLRSFYETHRDSKRIEVVFLSLDSTPQERESYFNKDHGDWLCVEDFAEGQKIGQDLAKKYGIYGIPTLLLFQRVPGRAAGAHAEPAHAESGLWRWEDTSYELVCSHARDLLPSDPAAQQFPWKLQEAQLVARRRRWVFLTKFLFATGFLYFVYRIFFAKN